MTIFVYEMTRDGLLLNTAKSPAFDGIRGQSGRGTGGLVDTFYPRPVAVAPRRVLAVAKGKAPAGVSESPIAVLGRF